MTYTVGSLFAGIGGFDLGFERAGFKTAWQVEIDPYCQKVLAKNFPEAERFGDIRECGSHNLKPVDVICGGFPCQDISNIGLRSGIEGEQSGLWKDFGRIIRELRPRVVIIENVAALVGFGLETVLCDLAASRFDAEWEVISAGDAGADHERERLWIFANPEEESWIYESFSLLREARLLAERSQWWKSNRWDEAAPKLCRMDDGIPNRVHRTECLGNSVVTVIPEMIARRIKQALDEKLLSCPNSAHY